MNTVTYTIPNISCHHCVHTIKSEVSDIQGVLSVEGDPQSKVVTISYEAPATTDEIETLLEEINYPVQK